MQRCLDLERLAMEQHRHWVVQLWSTYKEYRLKRLIRAAEQQIQRYQRSIRQEERMWYTGDDQRHALTHQDYRLLSYVKMRRGTMMTVADHVLNFKLMTLTWSPSTSSTIQLDA